MAASIITVYTVILGIPNSVATFAWLIPWAQGDNFIYTTSCMSLTGHDNYKVFMKYMYVEQATKESMHIFMNTITDKSPIAV